MLRAGLFPISSISKATQRFLWWKGAGKRGFAQRGEGAFMCTSKDPVVTESKLGCLPTYLHYSLVYAFQMPSFISEQKLLSGLIYNPDLLMGP